MKKTLKTSVEKVALKQAISYLEGDPEKKLPKLAKAVDTFAPDYWFPSVRKAIREGFDEDNGWYQMFLRLYDLNEGVRKTFFENFLINSSMLGNSYRIERMEKENCNIPWAVLLDPTSACNLKCTGCWAAEYGHDLSLSLEDIDSIVNQGIELGIYMYIYTGGEPMVRHKDLITICEKHPDCIFLSFTNGTMINEEFCQEMLRVKNFIPAISLEGFEEATDSRRGEGVFNKVKEAMELLKSHGLLFGISACYTSRNYEDITSEAFIDYIIDNGALFVWFFHYMPVGNDADTSLLLSPDQREHVCRQIRKYRGVKPLFTIDFQNDGAFVGGCIAGGKFYLHINAKGDVEPCVFIHYSNCNIHETTLLDALKSPLFMAYRKNQPFNDNMLRPCPMLENPEKIEQMVHETGAKSTDYQSEESVEHLTEKTRPYAENWKDTADRLNEELQDKKVINI